MRILVTNDDGIEAAGIVELAAALAELGEIIVVAPDREQSACSHTLTLHRPLRMEQVREHWYAVDGTPTDCVHLAVQGMLREAPPALVASGINHDLNLGDDVTYSGTVAAAFEANLLGLPAVAFSQEMKEGHSFAAAAGWARDFLAAVIRERLDRKPLFNVNFPARPFRGARLTRLGHRVYHQTVVEKTDPKGRRYFWIAGFAEWFDESGTDHAALAAGYVAVTPMHLDLTDYPGLERYAPLCAGLDRRWEGAASDEDERGQGSA